MKISELLDKKVNELCDHLAKYPFENFEHYTTWATQHYYLIRTTPHLLHLCTGNVPVDNHELFEEFSQHLSEEMYHNQLMEKDMKNIGYDMSQLSPCAPVISTIELQHHFINKYGPIVFLGYGLVLEGAAFKIGQNMADRIEKGLNHKSTFLNVHVKSDEDHYPDGLARIDGFISSEQEKQALINNAIVSTYNYIGILNESRTIAESRIANVNNQLSATA